MKYEEITVRQGDYTPLAPYNPVKDEWVLIFPVASFDPNGYTTAIRCLIEGKPTIEQIKHTVIGWHNEQIDTAILSGHKWREMPVWLSAENQTNYKATFDLAMQFQGQGGTLPVTFKLGTELDPVYHKFETLEELADFYLSTVAYVKDTLSEGWERKDSIDWSVYGQE